MIRCFVRLAPAIAVCLSAARVAGAQAPGPAVDLVVRAGRPLQVALDRTVIVRRAGQPVTGTLVEPVYVYDCIVLPGGAKVLGHVERLDGPSRLVRVRAMLAGDFTPARRVVIQFDTVVLADGRRVSVRTIVTGEVRRPTRSVAAGADADEPNGRLAKTGRAARTRAEETVAAAKQKAGDMLATIERPGRMERLKEAALQRLPYHPQFLSQGTAYVAELLSPLDFGPALPAALAPAGALPAPSSILSARLVTAIDSAHTPRGTPIRAVVTQPVFSPDGRIILPEGTTLLGEVTFTRRAGRFRRNGQLRFLFERVQPPDQQARSLLASLYSVEASADRHVAVDEEGGTTLTNPRTRFVAPALAILALRASTDHDHHFDNDGDANDVAGATVQSGHLGSRAFGGFLGLGVVGIALSQISQPIGVGLAIVGVARTVYASVLSRGNEIAIPADTSIQLQLAPGPTPRR